VESHLNELKLVSLDGQFEVIPATHTITAEEVPQIISRIGNILMTAVQAFYALLSRDPTALSAAIVRIYDDIMAIKKMVED
jgi:hypothetical protein